MEIIPAIDLMEGKVVRLSEGKLDTVKSYKGLEDPLQVAKKWEKEGAEHLHVIDLDAATGKGENRRIISRLIGEVSIPVQVGGGIRSREVVKEMLNLGAERVIVATLAFENENLLKDVLNEFGHNRIMVALDYLNGVVMTRGWGDSTHIPLEKAVDKFLKLGVELFLLTSISRDGLLTGPDLTTLEVVVKQLRKGLFVAGGINTVNDLIKLNDISVKNAIVGKALYEGRFSLKEAIMSVR